MKIQPRDLVLSNYYSRVISVFIMAAIFIFGVVGCSTKVLRLHDESQNSRHAVATLELPDSSMVLTGMIDATNNTGRSMPRNDLASTRIVEVSPGQYDVSIFYEHLGYSRCWPQDHVVRCTKTLDRGWWLPGSTLIPGRAHWEAEPGKTYIVQLTQEYWSIAEHGEWSPVIVEKSLE